MPAIEALCRDIAIALTMRPSVTGSSDEAAFGPWLAEYLAGLGCFGPSPEIWTFPVAPGDSRLCVALLLRRSGTATVLLTGHYDTVTTTDYAELRPLATQPGALATALAQRIKDAAPGTAEARARDDLASGRFLPGRGLLDMKAGLAAGLAAIAAFAADPSATGNLLFLAVPDEENASAGAKRAAAELGALAKSRGLSIKAAINLDSTADDGDGTDGRVIALGSVGKVLPTAFVVGTPVHSGFPLRGVNAAVLAAAIAQRLEWAPELTDATATGPGTPVSLLSLRDGKAGYDVTTPGTAFATWSVLNYRRTPLAVLDAVEVLIGAAVADCLSSLRDRAAVSGQPAHDLPAVPVIRFSQLLAEARAADPGLDADLDLQAGGLRQAGLSQPEISHALTAAVWQAACRSGPAVVLGLGSMPYLAVELSDTGLRRNLEDFAADASRRHQTTIHTVDFFAGISDMSFFGEGDATQLATLRAETPGWDSCIGLTEQNLAGVPTINVGPWGRDYHTALERIETGYGFGILPQVLIDLCYRLL